MSELIGRRTSTSPNDLREDIEAEGRGDISPIPLPWIEFNRAIGHGLKLGCVSILAGSPGASKSFMALNAALCAQMKGFNWKYLPIEDAASDWIMRGMAVYLRDWKMISLPEDDNDESRQSLARYKLDRLDAHRDVEGRLFECILENPRLPINAHGEAVCLPVPYSKILDFVQREGNDTDLLIIDPISQVDFSDDGKDWRGQQDFMQRLTGIVKAVGCHVMLVCHLTKRPGRSSMLSTLDDLQGSAAFSKLAHYCFLLDRHDLKESEVYSAFSPVVDHKLTMSVAKARGGFSGSKIAFDLMTEGPGFHEHGVIRPPVKGSKK